MERHSLLKFIIKLNDLEIDEFVALLQLLSTMHLNDKQDKLVWKLKNNGMFTVNSYYNHLAKGSGENVNFPVAQLIWRTKTPPRIAFFAWEASR